MAANTNATVTLSLVDQTQARMASLRRDIEALAKVNSQPSAGASGQAQVASLQAQAAALKDAERGWQHVNTEAAKAKQAMSGLKDASLNVSRSAIGAAGVEGPVGTLLAAGGIAGLLAAVGAIVGQSIRMAYEFEKSATHAAQALSVGTGPNLQANISALKTASAQGLAYNLSRPEMMQALQTYGSVSGTGVRATAAAAQGIGMYSRAYGMEPNQVAEIVGRVTAMSGRGFNEEAAGMFGAAENAGNLGQRLPEFMQVATSTLAQLQSENARGGYTGATAAGLVANIAGLGGYYQTPGGVAAFRGAGQSLTGSMGEDPMKRALAARAGISLDDIVTDRGGPANELKMLRSAITTLGPNARKSDVDLMLTQSFGVSGQNARNLTDPLYNKVTERANDPLGAIHQLTSILTPKSYAGGEADLAAKRVAEYKNSELGHMESAFTKIQEMQLKLGEMLLGKLQGGVDWLNKILNGDFKGAALQLLGGLGQLGGFLALNTVALAKMVGGGFMDLLKGTLGGKIMASLPAPMQDAVSRMMNPDDQWHGLGRQHWVDFAHHNKWGDVPDDIRGALTGRAPAQTSTHALDDPNANDNFIQRYLYARNQLPGGGTNDYGDTGGEVPGGLEFAHAASREEFMSSGMTAQARASAGELAKFHPDITATIDRGSTVHKGLGHGQGRAIDVGMFGTHTIENDAFTRRVLRQIIKSGAFQHIGTLNEIITDKSMIAYALKYNHGVNPFFEDDAATGATGHHVHFEVDPGSSVWHDANGPGGGGIGGDDGDVGTGKPGPKPLSRGGGFDSGKGGHTTRVLVPVRNGSGHVSVLIHATAQHVAANYGNPAGRIAGNRA